MEINKLYSIAESEGVTVDFINIPVAKHKFRGYTSEYYC